MAPPQKHCVVRHDSLISLLPALRALCSLLQTSHTKGIIIGGVAASLLGQPRMTADVDASILLEETSVESFLHQAQAEGLISRVTNPLEFAKRSAMLLMKDPVTEIAIDIALGRLSFEREAILKATPVNVGDFSVPLPTPEDLVVMKAIAHRPKDILDIREIVLCRPDLNSTYIRQRTMEFAGALDMPELWTDIAGLFKTKRGRKRSSSAKKGRTNAKKS